MKISKLIIIGLLIPFICFAGRIDNRLFQSGTTTITTDESGNGTVTITFPTTFSTVPDVFLVKPLYNVKGIYGVKNSNDMIVAKGRQPIGGISAKADGGTGYTQITDNTTSTGTITNVEDNGDGKCKITDAAHGLNYGNVINIYDSDSAKVNGFFSISQIATNSFVIDRNYTAAEYNCNWREIDHDLLDDDLIHIYNSTNYNDAYYTVSSATDTTWEINETYVAETNTKCYWKLLPSITATAAVLEVYNCDVKGGSVSIFWMAVERR